MITQIILRRFCTENLIGSPPAGYSQYIPPRDSGTFNYFRNGPPQLPPHLLQSVLNAEARDVVRFSFLSTRLSCLMNLFKFIFSNNMWHWYAIMMWWKYNKGELQLYLFSNGFFCWYYSCLRLRGDFWSLFMVLCIITTMEKKVFRHLRELTMTEMHKTSVSFNAR